MTHGVGDALFQAFSDRIAACTGLRFDAARRADLHRAIHELIQGSDSGDAHGELGRWLARPWLQADIETLAEHICVGETYFFRESAAFDMLEHELLPPLIARRRVTTRKLRVWSAGCSTGEEVHSLAIMLSRLVPDNADWDIVILGTDIHPGFLAQAKEGVYGDWSFRGVPDVVRELYFDALDERRFAVKSAQRRLTRFCYANLAQPAAASNFDLILCRNVLIYFDRDQALLTVQRLRSSLADDGLLQVGATEAGAGLFQGFREVRIGQAVCHRKLADFGLDAAATKNAPAAAMRMEPPMVVSAADADASSSDLKEALTRCEVAILRDKCDAMLHVQHAALLEESLRPQQAKEALRRALFLDPTLALAREALRRLTWRDGRGSAGGVTA